jgi:hypothetical protein
MNHDVTHINNGGANVGKTLEQYRDDFIYLGHNFAKIWLTEKIDLNLIHPTDGSSIAISMKAQKIVDSATGVRRSKIMAIGHYHKMNWLYYKGVNVFLVPSFQFQTPFMESNNLASYVGGFILTIQVDNDGELIGIIPEFVDLGK